MISDWAVTIREQFARARSALSSRRELASNLSLTVATNILIQVITVGSGVILARVLGPQGRGDLAIAMLWPTLVSGVGTLGISDALTYRAAIEGRGPSLALTNALLIALVQSLVLGAVGWAVIVIALHGNARIEQDAKSYLWYVPLNLLTLYPVSFLQGRMRMRSFNLVRVAPHLAYTALLAVLWVSHHLDVRAALAASLLANGITLGLCAIMFTRRESLDLVVRGKEVKALLTLGLQLQLGNVSFLLASRIDFIMLSILAPTPILGEYVVGAAVGALPLLVPSAASLLLYPIFSRRRRERSARPFARFMALAILATICAVPLVVLVSPLVVQLFFGSAFTPAVRIAQILGLASLLRGMSVMLTAVLRGLKAPIRASGGDFIGLVIAATLIVPAIRLAHGEGAAVAVFIGTAAATCWMTYHAMRIVNVGPIELVRWWRVDLGGSIAGLRDPH